MTPFRLADAGPSASQGFVNRAEDRVCLHWVERWWGSGGGIEGAIQEPEKTAGRKGCGVGPKHQSAGRWKSCEPTPPRSGRRPVRGPRHCGAGASASTIHARGWRTGTGALRIGGRGQQNGGLRGRARRKGGSREEMRRCGTGPRPVTSSSGGTWCSRWYRASPSRAGACCCSRWPRRYGPSTGSRPAEVPGRNRAG